MKDIHMTDEQRTTYMAWLNDARAMELALIPMLEKQIQLAEDNPEMLSVLEAHLEETRGHAKLVESCIERHQGDISESKEFLGKFTSAMGGMGMSMSDDAIVKHMLNSYAAEHLEIASYTSLHAAAEMLGDKATMKICDDILEDEIRMAEWVEEQIPAVTAEHLGAKVLEEVAA